MEKTRIFALLFLLASLAVLIACTQVERPQVPAQRTVPAAQDTIIPQPSASDVPAKDMPAEPAAQQQEQAAPPAQAKESIKEFTMTAKRWEFTPTTITVNKGDAVVLRITSTDVKHGFNLPDFNVREDLTPGQEVVVRFVADKAGTFDFRCDVFCGSGHTGMTGRLIVNP